MTDGEGWLRIGKYRIRQADPGKVWIASADGEGGQFPEADLEAAIEEFFEEHF
jgi:hypothetical protein